MVVIWKKPARLDLQNYFKYTETLHPEEYIFNLIDYVDTLKTFPNLGIEYIKIYDFEIHFLIYRMHKVYYYIKNNKINIIKVAHTHMNEATILKSLKNLLN